MGDAVEDKGWLIFLMTNGNHWVDGVKRDAAAAAAAHNGAHLRRMEDEVKCMGTDEASVTWTILPKLGHRKSGPPGTSLVTAL